jgi:hypothetical protein
MRPIAFSNEAQYLLVSIDSITDLEAQVRTNRQASKSSNMSKGDDDLVSVVFDLACMTGLTVCMQGIIWLRETKIDQFFSHYIIVQLMQLAKEVIDRMTLQFRPNFVVRGAGAFDEDAWTSLTVGSFRFEVILSLHCVFY